MIEDKIRAALADRAEKLKGCPVRSGRWIADKECPKCKATTAGPCWLNVEADSIFVDTVKALVE